MPFKQVYYPNRKKRDDAKIGNTAIWPVVERAKKAGVGPIKTWRKNKTVVSAAEDLHCYDGVNAIVSRLNELIREKRRK